MRSPGGRLGRRDRQDPKPRDQSERLVIQLLNVARDGVLDFLLYLQRWPCWDRLKIEPSQTGSVVLQRGNGKFGCCFGKDRRVAGAGSQRLGSWAGWLADGSLAGQVPQADRL